MTVKEFLDGNKLADLEDFEIKECRKIADRVKELNTQFEALDDKTSIAGLNVAFESQLLVGKAAGMEMIMDYIEHLAKIS
jgi:hypothetical protein